MTAIPHCQISELHTANVELRVQSAGIGPVTRRQGSSQQSSPVDWPYSTLVLNLFGVVCQRTESGRLETTTNAHGELCSALSQPTVQGVVTLLRAQEVTSPLWCSRCGHQNNNQCQR